MNEVRGVGRAIFAAVFLMIAGILNIIWGIAAIGNAHFFVANTHYVFASLKGWGWITLIIGILEVLASLSLFGGGEFGRWFGMIAAGLAALAALLSIPAYPLWSIAIFGLALWIIFGLAVYGQPVEGASPPPPRAPTGTQSQRTEPPPSTGTSPQ